MFNKGKHKRSRLDEFKFKDYDLSLHLKSKMDDRNYQIIYGDDFVLRNTDDYDHPYLRVKFRHPNKITMIVNPFKFTNREIEKL